jgi:transcriptional regulator with XRE-family HTH domain
MSSQVHCYSRTLRRQWGLTQEELAALLPSGSRNWVSRIERGKTPPNAGDILAYTFIFGPPAPEVFPQFAGKVEESVMQHVYALYERLKDDRSPRAVRKRELIEQIRARAASASSASV